MSLLDDNSDTPNVPPGVPVEGRFVDADHVVVPDFDGGTGVFGPVIRSPSTATPAAGDTAWLLETPDGRYLVLAWSPQ